MPRTDERAMDGEYREYEDRLAHLREILAHETSLAVAFSGGVDSSVLLHAALSVLGPWDTRTSADRDGFERARGAAGVIADSPSLPRRELHEARALAREIGAPLCELSTDEMEDARYRENRGDRCYFCKSALFRAMEPWARSRGFSALAFGEIADDLLDDRPGARAAREFGVIAPLSASGFTKADVRRYARAAGLPVAEKPASACLASRLPVGTIVTRERLLRVERSEEVLRHLGLRELRVRDHAPLARVEVGRGEIEHARECRQEIESLLFGEGFERVEIAMYVPPAERAATRSG